MQQDMTDIHISMRTSVVSQETFQISRRLFLGGSMAALACNALVAQDVDSNHGRVRPAIALPDLDMVLSNGSKSTLHAILGDQATAIQLMFTACRTTCPMEGAIFEKVQNLIPDQMQRRLQLLSLSVNATGEEPGALDAWLKRYHARAGWLAAAPAPKDLAAFTKLFGQGRTPGDPHSTQVQMVDRHRQLIWRTSELPSASEVAAILGKF